METGKDETDDSRKVSDSTEHQTEMFEAEPESNDLYRYFHTELIKLLRSGTDFIAAADNDAPNCFEIAPLVAALENRDEELRSLRDRLNDLPATEAADADSAAGNVWDEAGPEDIRHELAQEKERRELAEEQETALREQIDDLLASLAEAQAAIEGSHAETIVVSEKSNSSAQQSVDISQKNIGLQLETRLLVTQLDDQEIEFVVDRDNLTIGRTTENDIHLKSSSVSRRHARIVKEDGRPRILDCGSKNGVFVNAFRIEEQELRDGDQITIGNVELVFKERVRR